MTLRASLFLLFLALSPALVLAQEETTKPDSETETETVTPAAKKLLEGEEDPALNEPIRTTEQIAAEEAARESKSFDSGSAFLSVMSSLLAVLAVIVALAWVAKKYLPKQLGVGGSGNNLKLIQSLPLGGNQRFVSIIEADGRRFLIGVTENNINLIRDLEALDFEGALTNTEPRSVRELLEAEG